MLLLFLSMHTYVIASSEDFDLCPLCDQFGEIICPNGYEAACASDEIPGPVPKCLLHNAKLIPGCWQFIGVQKIDLGLEHLMPFPNSMVEIIGGGETYTLNREIVGCKKL